MVKLIKIMSSLYDSFTDKTNTKKMRAMEAGPLVNLLENYKKQKTKTFLI